MQEDSKITTVYNLENPATLIFTLPPRNAVIAAYAQNLGDYNTWDYEIKYNSMVLRGDWGWHLGNFSAPFSD